MIKGRVPSSPGMTLTKAKLGATVVGTGFLPLDLIYRDDNPSRLQACAGGTCGNVLVDGKVRHGGHPVLRWMADCLTVKQDVNGNIRPVKPDRLKGSRRIDGMVALIMAMSRAMVDDSSESVYSRRGLLMI